VLTATSLVRRRAAIFFGMLLFSPIILLLLFTPPIAHADQGGYVVTAVDPNNMTAEQKAAMQNDSSGFNEISFWQLPLWIQISCISSLSIFTLISSLMVLPLVSRRFNKNENHNRVSVLSFISGNPGCTAPELARQIDINIGTVRYHIHKLCDEGRIVLVKMGKYSRLFVNKSAFDEREKLIASHLRSDASRSIISVIMENPGINNQKLSEKLCMEKSLVYRHVQKLLEDNIITYEWEGKSKLYYIDMDAKPALIELMPLHYQCPGLMKEK